MSLSGHILKTAHTAHLSGTRMKLKKSVRFSDMCKVVLIPMRQEYSAAGINLWWTSGDFHSFKQGYMTEKYQNRSLRLEDRPSPPLPEELKATDESATELLNSI